MTDKVKFHNMTKPIKFRRIKMCKQYLVLWGKAQRERINYYFNYLLYKLNILKRYSYRDNVERELSPPHSLEDKSIMSTYFGGIVRMRLISSRDIDIDYFYREKKDGSKKITFTLKDHVEEKLFTVSHLESIHIKVGDVWHSVDHLPVFKVASFIEPEPSFIDTDFLQRPTEYKTVEYDIMKIKLLRHKLLIGYMSPKEISEEMYKYYYEYTCSEMRGILNNISLADIMK